MRDKELDPYEAELLELQRRRNMAQAQIAQGMETTPIRHWSQGAARVLASVLGNREAERVSEQMREVAARRESDRAAEMGQVRDLLTGTPTVHQPSGWANGDAIDAGGEAQGPSVSHQRPDRAQLARALLGMKNPKFQGLGMQMALQQFPEEKAYTLGPDQVRMRGSREIARGIPKPVEPKQEPVPEGIRLSRIANDPNASEYDRATARALLAKMTREPAGASETRAPVLIQTPDGPKFAYPPRDPSGQVQMVATGEKPQPRDMPASMVEKFAQNRVTLAKIDKAMDVVDRYPDAFGLANKLGDTIRQRTDPKGIEGRALIADIAGQKIHDRSGAAVTVGEAERLKPYVPNVTDTPETVKQKLALFRQEYAAMQGELAQGRGIMEATRRGNSAGGQVGVPARSFRVLGREGG